MEHQTISTISPADLLASAQNRLVVLATLAPIAGKTRFQPAGFPEIGHVIYSTPDNQKVCIVDSPASMANHLETVCVQGFDLSLVEELSGLPYVECVTGERKSELVVTTFSEGHRLASDYFLEGNRILNDSIEERKFGEVLRNDEFKLRDLKKKTHPLPAQWWNVFNAIFRYDPNSLVHGILFPAMGIKLARVLTASLDAFGADRVATSGVKFDKLGHTNSGQPIFAKDEETASEIRATFTIDLALIRSFGRGNDGLGNSQKELVLGFALWKIGKLLGSSFRYRSECDLELTGIQINGMPSAVSALSLNMPALIKNAKFQDPRVTKIYWNENELFKLGKDMTENGKNGSNDDSGQSNEAE